MGERDSNSRLEALTEFCSYLQFVHINFRITGSVLELFTTDRQLNIALTVIRNYISISLDSQLKECH
jgi:hypothetical protein